MKKLFTFLILACPFLVGNAQDATVTKTVFEVNYASLITDYAHAETTNIAVSSSGSTIAINETTNTNQFTASPILTANLVTINPIRGTYVRINNAYSIGLYNSQGYNIGLVGLKSDDIVEIACNGGGNANSFKDDVTPSAIFNLSSPEKQSEQYTLSFALGNNNNRTLAYSVYQMKVSEDGNALFSTSDQATYIAYIKIIRNVPETSAFIAGATTANETVPTSSSDLSMKTVTFGNPSLFSFALTSTTGSFRNPNRNQNTQLVPVGDNNYVQPLLVASGQTYNVIKSSNITSIKLYGRRNSNTSTEEANVRNGSTVLGTLYGFGGEVSAIDIYDKDSGVDYTSFNVTSNAYLAFEITYTNEADGSSEKANVEVGGDFYGSYMEWNAGLASGVWKGTADNPFANIMKVSNSNNYELGLTVSVTPNFTQVTEPDEWSESVGMPEWLWNQMKGIEDSKQAVDGYYEASTSISPAVSVDDKTASITYFYMPCSGAYNVNVATLNPYDVTLTNGYNTINVYPSTNLTYSTYTITGNGDEDIVIKSDNLQLVRTSDNANTAILYIPGVYCLDGAYYSWNPEETVTDGDVNKQPGSSLLKRKAGEVPTTYYEIDMDTWKIDIPANLSGTLYLILSKNNVSTPIVSSTTNKSESQIEFTSIPTAVEAVEAVDGPAEYFNLQGVKIANPDHGIFIKVQNGKASKVIL